MPHASAACPVRREHNTRFAGSAPIPRGAGIHAAPTARADISHEPDCPARELTGPQAEDLYQLIDERLGRSSLIVTSNRSPQDWYPLFPNPVLAESILDRLAGTAHQLTLTGKSYRPRLRPTTDSVARGGKAS